MRYLSLLKVDVSRQSKKSDIGYKSELDIYTYNVNPSMVPFAPIGSLAPLVVKKYDWLILNVRDRIFV